MARHNNNDAQLLSKRDPDAAIRLLQENVKNLPDVISRLQEDLEILQSPVEIGRFSGLTDAQRSLKRAGIERKILNFEDMLRTARNHLRELTQTKIVA